VPKIFREALEKRQPEQWYIVDSSGAKVQNTDSHLATIATFCFSSRDFPSLPNRLPGVQHSSVVKGLTHGSLYKSGLNMVTCRTVSAQNVHKHLDQGEIWISEISIPS
jgi:hypothetical protein